MKIIFAGTPSFASAALKSLIASDHNIIAVYTQPDRPAGRGRKLTMSPVKTLALENNIPIYQPITLRDAQEQKILQDLSADVMIVAAYGLILPQPILTAPKLGCINIHASLLPRWRGAAPIQRAILAGDPKTGITIMKMDEGLDTGDMLYKIECNIEENDTSETLLSKLTALGSDALLKVITNLPLYLKNAVAQDEKEVTYAKKIIKEETEIHWDLTAIEINHYIRAFYPAFFTLNGTNIRVFESQVMDSISNQHPGEILNINRTGLDIATKQGIIRFLRLQFPGGRPLLIQDLINSHHPFKIGMNLNNAKKE